MTEPRPPDPQRTLTERLSELYGAGVDPHVSLQSEAEGGEGVSKQVLERLVGHHGRSGRYELRGEIARGGMGAILKIWDQDLRRFLAMKVILGQEGTQAGESTPPATVESVSRFLEEAQLTGQLDHPGIVPVHEIGLDDAGRVYFTMKLVKGETLRHVFGLVAKGEEGWTQTKVLGVLLKVCEAMAYAHHKGVIHRDLKPANIMVGKFGEVHVMDWGLARVLSQADAKDLRIRDEAPRSAPSIDVRSQRTKQRAESADAPLVTMDGDVVGTPAYMPPEQAAGNVGVMGPHSDVYAMGAMLYHLLAGQMPFVPKDARLNSYAIWGLVQQGPPTPLEKLAPDTPAELVAICEKAMARDWKQRYPDMSALAADLSAYLEHRVVGAYQSGAWAETKKWIERNRALAASLLAVVAALVVGLVVSLSLKQVADEHERAARANEEAARREKESVLRLSAFQTLDDLTREVDALWPAEPALVASYRAWTLRAQELVGRLPGLRATLAEIEQRAAASDDDRWWQAQMHKLIEALTAFDDAGTGLLRGTSPAHGWGVERRLEFALALQERSVSGADAARRWSEAADAIAKSVAYRASSWPSGARITPQAGLLPIGADPASGLWEFAHLASGAPAERGPDGKLLLKEETGLVLVLVPGGTFLLGAQSTDPSAPSYDREAKRLESPVQELTLAPFFLSKYEMTQGQWTRFAGRNPSQHSETNYRATWNREGLSWSALHPVEQVSWLESVELLARMSLVLPTEAQWEYAARAGTTTKYWSGDDVESLQGVANVVDQNARSHGGSNWSTSFADWDDGHTVHAPVGSYRANPFGLHDVHGNNWEWCRDGYGPYTLPTRAGDGLRDVPDAHDRVIRGGGFVSAPSFARCSIRGYDTPEFRVNDLGLRPSRIITP